MLRLILLQGEQGDQGRSWGSTISSILTIYSTESYLRLHYRGTDCIARLSTVNADSVSFMAANSCRAHELVARLRVRLAFPSLAQTSTACLARIVSAILAVWDAIRSWLLEYPFVDPHHH